MLRKDWIGHRPGQPGCHGATREGCAACPKCSFAPRPDSALFVRSAGGVYCRVVSDFDDVRLNDTASAALETLVNGYAELVLGVLRDTDVEGAVCSVCIAPEQEPLGEHLPRIFAGSVEDRARLVDDADDVMGVWDPYAYRDEEDVVHPVEDGDDETWVEVGEDVLAAWVLVRDAVEPHVLDPTHWVLARVARRLNRERLPLETADDVVVWSFDDEFDPDRLRDQLTFVLAPEALSGLRTLKLLP